MKKVYTASSFIFFIEIFVRVIIADRFLVRVGSWLNGHV